MKNDVKPTFVNLIVIDNQEVDIKTLTAAVKEDVALQLNRRAMIALGYHETRTA